MFGTVVPKSLDDLKDQMEESVMGCLHAGARKELQCDYMVHSQLSGEANS